MLLNRSRLVILLSAALATACTQEPARVELKGHNSYTRNGIVDGGSVASNATTQAAAVSSIGVSELSAPTGAKTVRTADNAKFPNHTPFQYAKLSPAAGPSSRVNPWTKQPRDNAPTAAVSQLDSVIDHEDSAPATKVQPVTSAGVKSAKLASASSHSFIWPVASKKIISGYGPKGHGKVNDGINIASSDGEPVWAAADGEVIYVGNELKDYGNMVLIKHSGDKSTTYAHLSKATVEKYEHVKQGAIIGYVGATGNIKESQLHFAVRSGKDAVDPLKYLDRSVASAQ